MRRCLRSLLRWASVLYVGALILSSLPMSAQSTTVLGASDSSSVLALTDSVTAYQMLSPDVKVSVAPPVSELQSLAQLLEGSLDFISTTAMLSPNLTAPTSSMYDAAASDLLWCPYLIAPLVPIYRLDSVVGTSALTLSSSTLCLIYTGNISWWNDSRLTAINPTLTLPNTPITVVVEAVPAAMTLLFTQAMSTVCSAFSHSIGVTANPVWPSASYAGYIRSTLPASSVLVQNGAVGFAALPVALVANVNVAAMLNKNNQTVVASALSATFAATELLAQATSVALTGSQPAIPSALMPATLDNPTGQQAWPMTIVSAFVIHTNSTSNTSSCESRAALVSFINFMYTSTVAAAILANRQYAVYPSVALNDLSLPGLLRTSVFCEDGSLAYSLASSQALQSTAPPPTTHTLYGNARLSSVLSLVAGLFSHTEQSAGVAIEVQYAGTVDIWLGVEAVLTGEAEAALLTLDLLNLTQLATVLTARDSGQFYLLPMFVSAIVPLYNPVLNSSIVLPSTLTMDPATLLSVTNGSVTDWRSAQLSSVVAPQSLSSLSSPLPIRFVSPCDPSAPGASLREFYSLFVPFVPSLSASLYDTTDSLFAACNSSYYDTTTYVSGQQHGTFPAPSESSVPSVINAVNGAVGYQRATGSAESAVIYVDFGRHVGGVTANVSSMLACLDAFDADTLMAPLNASTNPSCYLFSRTVYAIVPTSITDTAGDGCAARSELLTFLQQLTESSLYDSLLDDQLLVRAGQVQAVQNAVLDALNSITCIEPLTGDWDTLLVQTPIVWTLSRVITSVGLALGSIGIVCAVASFALTAVFHRHSVMRAASPVFLCLTLLGLAVMFVSSLMLSLPPSTSSCAGLSWCFHLGFQLAFAPLLAKTYRVYRIYGGQKLSVVKLSNSRLSLIVGGLLGVELALLAAFQIVSPMRPLTVSRTSGSPLRLHDYSQCSVDSDGMPLFLALCIEKGVVLLLGALMAFSTRRVSATYSESSGIAWSIYNLILSMAVLIPLVLLIDAVGDTLVALLLFALLWVSAFTLTVLFVPRLAAMFSKAESLDEHDSGARVIGDDGFSFLSLASFEAGSGAMGQYVAALELHLAQAKARHSQLRQGDTKGKEWMKATAGRKQSVASVNQDSSHNPSPHPAEQRKVREKSIATATGGPKPSISYMTQTNYNEAARSNAGSPSLGAVPRPKFTAPAPSARAQPPVSYGANRLVQQTDSTSVSTTMTQPIASPSEMKQLNEQKNESSASSDDTGLVTAIEAATVVRPASVSRSRSIKVQPSFEKAVSPRIEKRTSTSRSAQVAVAETQPDASSKPEVQTQSTQQQQTKEAANPSVADSAHYSLPALPVADDMVVHDLSTRMARASIDEGQGPATDETASALRSPSIMRPRANSSRGILMTPVTGSTTLSSKSSEDNTPAGDTQSHEQNGDLDIDTGEAMHDIE